MIELNKKYSTKELAQVIGVSYGQFRNIREKYENHLALFYDFTINTKGNGTSYIFNQQFDDYIPYKEYNKTISRLLLRLTKAYYSCLQLLFTYCTYFSFLLLQCLIPKL